MKVEFIELKDAETGLFLLPPETVKKFRKYKEFSTLNDVTVINNHESHYALAEECFNTFIIPVKDMTIETVFPDFIEDDKRFEGVEKNGKWYIKVKKCLVPVKEQEVPYYTVGKKRIYCISWMSSMAFSRIHSPHLPTKNHSLLTVYDPYDIQCALERTDRRVADWEVLTDPRWVDECIAKEKARKKNESK